MRKQYHFRNSANGILIWDVDKLVELSKGFKVFSLPLEKIKEIDEAYWFSGPGSVPTCRAIIDHIRLIEAVDFQFPIILSADGRIMDGMHRVAKAVLMGLSEIKAVQFKDDPEPDFLNVSADDLPY